MAHERMVAYAKNTQLNDSDSEVSLPVDGPDPQASTHFTSMLANQPSTIFEEPSVASLGSMVSLGSRDSRTSRDSTLKIESEADAILVEGILEAEDQGLDCLVQLLRGQKQLLDGKYTEAAEHLENALSAYIRGECDLDISIFVYTLLVDAYHGMGNYPRSISVAREWQQRYPNSVTSHSALAHILFEQGQFDDCIVACTSAVKSVQECEGLMVVYHTRGMAYRKKGLYEKSLQDFGKVKEMSQKKGLVRFREEKQPFLTSQLPLRTSHITPHAEKKKINMALVAFVRKSKRGVPSPDCSPDTLRSRKRGQERHFGKQNSTQRLLTARLGQIL